ncbi:hypothetical protein WJX84_009670 [Apatococcus fuscideae]|uniref:sn-1-specific diacylglycerol lipase n=1 Tax=Apatococcus fuscideae TaxID=2026836 RepID=A0AAW1TFF1_9CHLO
MIVVCALFVTYLLLFVTEAGIIWEGLKGSIFETERRWRVPYLLYVFAILYDAQIWVQVYGTHLILHQPPSLLNAVIWTTWIVLALMMLTFLGTFNLFPNYASRRSWEQRCRCLLFCCCCIVRAPEGYEGEQAPWVRLAELCVQVFGNADMTLSDVLTSFFLANALQRCKQQPASLQPRYQSSASDVEAGLELSCSRPESTSEGSPHQPLLDPGTAGRSRSMLALSEQAGRQHADINPASADEIQTAAHFCTFAYAAYGALLFIWSEQRYRGCCQLMTGRNCGMLLGPLCRCWRGSGSRNRIPDLKASNHMNREAIQQMTGLPDEDIVFVRFQKEGASSFCLPYFIAIDRSTCSVVLAIRGTLSFEDALTDLLCKPAGLDEWIREMPSQDGPPASFGSSPPPVQPAGEATSRSAHSGMVDVAKAVIEDLQREGVLQALLLGQNDSHHQQASVAPDPFPSTERQGTLPDCHSWNLVVTGHSLGAGIAALVAQYLRNYFPRMHCWAISPPGGVMDAETAEGTQEFCTSVVLGDDWVARLTLDNFERLHDDMMIAACSCKRSKVRFLVGALCGKVWREDELFVTEDNLAPEPASKLHNYLQARQAARSRGSRHAGARGYRPPGRLLSLQAKTAARRTHGRPRKYQATWVQPEELLKDGIRISSRMMADHMPDRIFFELQHLAKEATRRQIQPQD